MLVITQTQYSHEDGFVQIDLPTCITDPPAGIFLHAVFPMFLSNSEFIFLDSSYTQYFLMFVSCNCEVTGLFCASSVNLFCFNFFPYAVLGTSVCIRLENILSKIIRFLMSQKGFYFD